MHLIFISLLTLSFVNQSVLWRLGQIKQWLPNLEWSTSANWVDNSVPERKARVSFPLELFHSVGLPSNNLLISSLELPRDGALLLAQDGLVKFEVDMKSTKIRMWKLKGPFYWTDPNNWNSSLAVPHLERIPCSTDTVILPDKNHSLSINFPNTEVKVMEIKIGEKERIDEWRWESFMHGREFHRSRTSVGLSGLQYCGSNCLCKSDQVDELLAEICNIERARCGGPKCEYPIQVEGHCCYYCGGRVRIPAKSLRLSELNRIAKETLKNFEGSISWHARASWNDKNAEILITENKLYSGIKSQEAIDKLTAVLIAKGIQIIDAVTTGAALTGSTLGNTLGPMLGIPLVLFVLIAVALPYFGYSYNYVLSIGREAVASIRDGVSPDGTSHTSTSFGFARFENLAEGDVQLARAITAENELMEVDNEDHDNDNVGRGKRFENPLYRSRRKSLITGSQEDGDDIANIETVVSLNELQQRVYPSDDASDESD